MREDEPRDPSLALCQICGMKGEIGVYTIGCDGKPYHYRTCVRYTIGNCNHFVPGNIQRPTLQKQAENMMVNAQYGRF